MGYSLTPLITVTIIWVIFGIVLPFLPFVVREGYNRGVTRVALMLIAATCWFFWVLCYMAQMNPLIGPKLNDAAVYRIAKEWSGYIPA